MDTTQTESIAQGGSIQSVDRALKIFKLICLSDTPLSVKDISDITGLKRSTVNGLISTLAANNFVKKDSLSGKFVQGIGAFALSHNYPHQLPYLQNALNTWETLSQQYPGAQANLGLFDGERQVVVVSLNSYAGSQPLRGTMDFPMHASGVGKCLLAYLPETTVESIIQLNGLPKYTSSTITTPEALYEELARIRERGYAFDLAESLDNTFCVAFPLLGNRGNIVASLSFSSTKEVWEEHRESMLRNGLQTSKLCSQGLGWQPGRK